MQNCIQINQDCLFSLIVKHSIAMMKALPEMFPSPVAPPKKMGQASKAMLHILEVRHALTFILVQDQQE